MAKKESYSFAPLCAEPCVAGSGAAQGSARRLIQDGASGAPVSLSLPQQPEEKPSSARCCQNTF